MSAKYERVSIGVKDDGNESARAEVNGKKRIRFCIILWLIVIALLIVFAHMLNKMYSKSFNIKSSSPLRSKNTGLIKQSVLNESTYLILETSPINLRPGAHILYFGPWELEETWSIHALEAVVTSCVHHLFVERQHPESVGSFDASWKASAAAIPGSGKDLIFAWSKDSQPGNQLFRTPNGTGFTLGDQRYLRVEVHFQINRVCSDSMQQVGLHLLYSSIQDTNSKSVMKNLGIAEVAGFFPALPPRVKDATVCFRCQVEHDIEVVGFRNHGHSIATRYETFVVRNSSKLKQQVVNSPVQHRQFFQEASFSLSTSDVILLKCHYDTTKRRFSTVTGPEPKRQEMCNQYLVFYPDAVGQNWGTCSYSKTCKVK
uniref:Copper type II ascorbate-dependent monooxygenase C-terminal domain-containing protein n=1 Tax=Aplanochytrium stocchinoi TaxID=215587 RepID=A0A7S3LRB4_9STRA|mmetsp:Transcript_887/g.1227  ORF Transcript_887/g.1227 Transcript_887/m.1227 type:complete len:372 (+) Transcript_887:566-1681(+)